MKPAFFRDTRLVGTITVRPDSDRSPVVGSVQRVEYILVAPFKRLLFYLSIAVCSIAAVFLLVRVWRRLTTLEYTEISSPRVC
ncbi:MAG: hypothetical protein GXY83_37675 [Rhodopirellula sp.]|nr:hypothetical protein [Rhodopirellula sp.]